MSVKSRVLTVTSGILTAGTVAAVVVVSGQTGSTARTVAPTENVRTVASVQSTTPPPKIACFFEVDARSGKVLAPPALQPFETNVNDQEHCVLRVATHLGSSFVQVVTPTYPEGTFGVGNGTYGLSRTTMSLKGSARLAWQPKNGYDLACVNDHGVLRPYRAALHLPRFTCKLVGYYFAFRYQGIGFKLTLGTRHTLYQVGPLVKHPGLLHYVSLRAA